MERPPSGSQSISQRVSGTQDALGGDWNGEAQPGATQRGKGSLSLEMEPAKSLPDSLKTDVEEEDPELHRHGRMQRWGKLGGNRRGCRRRRTAALHNASTRVSHTLPLACRRLAEHIGPDCVCRGGRWRAKVRLAAARSSRSLALHGALHASQCCCAHQPPLAPGATWPHLQPVLFNGGAGLGGRNRVHAAVCGERACSAGVRAQERGTQKPGSETPASGMLGCQPPALHAVALRLGSLITQARRPTLPVCVPHTPPPCPSLRRGTPASC